MMKQNIMPYKQELSQGCLAACLLMLDSLNGISPVQEEEWRITTAGLSRKYKFYLNGQIEEFLKKSSRKLTVYVDNKYFTKVLTNAFNNKTVEVLHKKSDLKTIKELLNDSPVIVYIDFHAFGDYSHYPHFILVIADLGEKFEVIDPLFGKKQKILKTKLEKAINELRDHIKMCPIMIQ